MDFATILYNVFLAAAYVFLGLTIGLGGIVYISVRRLRPDDIDDGKYAWVLCLPPLAMSLYCAYQAWMISAS